MDAAPQWLPSPDSTEDDSILLFVQTSPINSSDHGSNHYQEGPGEAAGELPATSSSITANGAETGGFTMMLDGDALWHN